MDSIYLLVFFQYDSLVLFLKNDRSFKKLYQLFRFIKIDAVCFDIALPELS